MLSNWGTWGVIVLGATLSGVLVAILSVAIHVAGIEEQLSYGERLAAVYALPGIVLASVFAASPHYTVTSALFAALIAAALIVGSDLLSEHIHSR